MVLRAYTSLWIAIPVVLLLSIGIQKHAVDIQLHDTYWVIDLGHAGLFFSLLLGLQGWIYYLVRNRELTNWMSLFHISVSLFTVLIFMVYIRTWEKISHPIEIDQLRHWNQMLLGTTILWVIGQLIFVWNLVTSSPAET